MILYDITYDMMVSIMVSFDGNVYMIRSDTVSLQSDIHSNVHFEA